MLAVVILAAGESRRMGQPKALLSFPDFSTLGRAGLKPAPTNKQDRPTAKTKTFLEHLIEVTRHPRASILRVVIGAHAEEIRSQVKLDEDVIVVNEEWRRGQLSSLQAAIQNLSAGKTEGILVCLVDHPLISAQLISTLIETFERDKNKIIIPTYRGKRGHPVIFPNAMYAELFAAPENVGARSVVRAHAGDVAEIAVEEEGVVMNLNDPDALEKLGGSPTIW